MDMFEQKYGEGIGAAMNKYSVGIGDAMRGGNQKQEIKESPLMDENKVQEQAKTNGGLENFNKIIQRVTEITQKQEFSSEEVQFIKEFESILNIMAVQDSRFDLLDPRISKSLITAEVLSGARFTKEEVSKNHIDLYKTREQFGEKSEEYKKILDSACQVLRERAKQVSSGRPSDDGISIAEQFINAKVQHKKELEQAQKHGLYMSR